MPGDRGCRLRPAPPLVRRRIPGADHLRASIAPQLRFSTFSGCLSILRGVVSSVAFVARRPRGPDSRCSVRPNRGESRLNPVLPSANYGAVTAQLPRDSTRVLVLFDPAKMKAPTVEVVPHSDLNESQINTSPVKPEAVRA